MDIQEFAKKYDFKLKKDSCGDLIVLGRFRALDMKRFNRPEYSNHVFEGFDGGRLGLYIASTQSISQRVEKLQAAGVRLRQRAAAAEATFTFDPENDQQVRAVIQFGELRKIHRTGPLTDKQRHVLAAHAYVKQPQLSF
jgi:hypothetical protein